jgi:hypothetical protein
MGERDVARIDPSALREVARRYQSAADALSGTVVPLLRWSFGAHCAGRDYAGRGEALRSALEHSVDQLRLWSRAVTETAVALQVTADRYVATDALAASRIG